MRIHEVADHEEQCIVMIAIHNETQCPSCSRVLHKDYLNEHLDLECPMVPLICPLGCGEKIKRKEMDEHCEKECGMITEECEYCAEEMQRKYIDNHHLNLCQFSPALDCVFKNCPVKFSRDYGLENHLANDCLWSLCDLCSDEIKSGDDHDSVCDFQEIDCPEFCGERFLRKDADEHAKDCPNGLIDCIELQCPEKVLRSQLVDHLRKDCQWSYMECPNDCLQGMLRKDLEEHLETCPRQKVPCPDCSAKVTRQKLYFHHDSCPKAVISCPNCAEDVVRCDLKQHQDNDCVFMLCIFGCSKFIHGDKMVAHESECLMAWVECVGCKTELQRGDLEEHYRGCDKALGCDNNGCALYFPSSQSKHSHSLVCEWAEVDCPNGCGEILIRKYIKDHEEMCFEREIMCDMGCGEVLKQKYADEHFTVCVKRPATVRFLDPMEKDYQHVEAQFYKKWLHKKDIGKLVSILKISPAGELVENYRNYQQKIISMRPEFAEKGYGYGGPGNEQRRFHGTKRVCELGEVGTVPQFCDNDGCYLCKICTGGFELSGAGKNFGWLRFGKGIYLTSTSSKSDDYAKTLNPQLNTRVLLLCSAIVGRGKKLLDGDKTLTSAPEGYDSVLGEVGKELNYDETVLYSPHAVMPSFLIVYLPVV
eukprot:CAMPEP_0174275268 /NCGR_PEP_ID=MMETSP0439-20130205/59730_1 /TAXON_ID=0 /ORGANISM="Stereomyxa ramosa, Strain Chinc5" /LENGTH=646 /DNA_ID=CAMNT_0015367353 /DNA_START=988 /DNA_END=2928 /DNA_ORIENTATION=-